MLASISKFWRHYRSPKFASPLLTSPSEERPRRLLVGQTWYLYMNVIACMPCLASCHHFPQHMTFLAPMPTACCRSTCLRICLLLRTYPTKPCHVPLACLSDRLLTAEQSGLLTSLWQAQCRCRLIQTSMFRGKVLPHWERYFPSGRIIKAAVASDGFCVSRTVVSLLIVQWQGGAAGRVTWETRTISGRADY